MWDEGDELFDKKIFDDLTHVQVEPRYSRSFRWCHYLGKYFCTGCHSNLGHVVPARIIHQWDFKKYPVSNFSHEILLSMFKEPVFNVPHLNPALLKRVERFKQVIDVENTTKQFFRLSRKNLLSTQIYSIKYHKI